MSDSSACWSRLAGRLAVWTSDWPQQCSTPSAGFICEFHSSRVGTNDLCMETMSTRRRAGARCVSSPAVLTETQFVDPGNRTTLIEHVDRRACFFIWTLNTLDTGQYCQYIHSANETRVNDRRETFRFTRRCRRITDLPRAAVCVSEFIIFLSFMVHTHFGANHSRHL